MRRRSRLSLFFMFPLVFVFLFLVTSSGVAQNIYQPTTQSPPQKIQLEIPPGWTVFRGQSGLIVPHPVGWKVQERGSGGFITFRPGSDGGAMTMVYVQPIAKIEGKATGVVQGLGQIAPELFPGVQVTKTRAVSGRPEVAVAELSFSPKGVNFIGVAMCFKEDPQGVLYAISSTSSTWNQEEPIMKQILSRFFYSGGQGQPGSASLPPMTLWRDPLEGAFTCPVPQGWKVEGGPRRFSLFDTRLEILVISLDNRILVRRGDAFIPPMTLPNQALTQSGFYEGHSQSSGGYMTELIMRYLPSTVFLTNFYLPQRMGAVSKVQTKDLPEISQQTLAHSGGAVRVDTGEITFDAQTEMGPRKGYGFVQTTLYGANWRISAFYGYLAEAQVEPVAQMILNRMVTGFKLDPNWEAMQVQAMLKGQKIARKSQQDTMDIITRTFENRSRTQDRMYENWSRAYRGEVLIQDPATGQKFEVPSGSNYYFRVGSENQFLGTETATPPYSPNHWLREMRIVN
jgi:hypothetical protein